VLIVFAICIQEIKTKPNSRMKSKLRLLCNGRVGNWAQNVCLVWPVKMPEMKLKSVSNYGKLPEIETHKRHREIENSAGKPWMCVLCDCTIALP